MKDLKELFTSMNPTHVNFTSQKCKTCDFYITDLDRNLSNEDINQCTSCFIKELQKTEDRDIVTMLKSSHL